MRNTTFKALVTGGAGFIGSHLAEALLAEGHSVTAIDNLSTGSAENVRHLRAHPGFRLVAASVLNEGVMQKSPREADVVYHMAAAVGVKWIIENPLLSIRTNLRATKIVLDGAAATETRVILASTSEAYGKNAARPLPEDAAFATLQAQADAAAVLGTAHNG